MPEYRLEPTKREIVVVSSKRAKRPRLFGRKAKPACPFCPGNENLTPPTTFALPDEQNWSTRCFRNAFPIFEPKGRFKQFSGKSLFWSSPGFGDHEVIVEAPEHGKLFQELDAKQLMLVFLSYKNRLRELGGCKGVKCVFLFKNHGKAGGASIEHEHAQIVALPFVPPVIQKEIEFSEAFWKKNKKCFFCNIKKFEKAVVFENSHFVAVRPSFARFPYEFWLVSKRCCANMLEFSPGEAKLFMKSLAECVKKAFNVSHDYNILFHNSPPGAGLHFHCEIIPRTNVWAGLEFGTGVIVDSRSEKEALQALSGKK